LIKSIDVYGVPVSLTYKSDPQIKSTVGGMATILARVAVAAFLGTQCKAVIDQKYTLQTSLLKRDLTTDDTMFNLTMDNFDFGLRLAYVLGAWEPDVVANLDQYIDLRVTQNYYFWVMDSTGTPQFNKTKVRTNLVPCGSNRLGMTADSPDYLGLKSTYLCPDKIDYQI
jgi:hypothetical protein